MEVRDEVVRVRGLVDPGEARVADRGTGRTGVALSVRLAGQSATP